MTLLRVCIRRVLDATARLGRILTRHYLSLASAAILLAALTLSLTSSSFTGDEQRRPEPTFLRSDDLRNVVSSPASEPKASHRVTYYLYSEDEQRKAVEEAVRSDALYLRRAGLPNTLGMIHFLKVTTDADEQMVQILAYELAPRAPSQGFDIVVVDLRSQ